MWQDCLNSEITFWVLVVLDLVFIVVLVVGFVWYLKDKKEHSKRIAEREAYLKRLETLKNRNYD